MRTGRRLVRRVARVGAAVAVVAVTWTAVLLYGEGAAWTLATAHCKWPTTAGPAVHIALIGDPQIADTHSYGHTGLLLAAEMYYGDLYMRRAFHRLQSSLRPDAVLFLGDLFDGGREFPPNSEDWDAEFARFQTIFRQRPDPAVHVPLAVRHTAGGDGDGTLGAAGLQTAPYMLYLAGNHDVGVGRTTVAHARDRFRARFGATSYAVELGGVRIVALNTLELAHGGLEVLQSAEYAAMHRGFNGTTDILISHIPLYRPPGTPCRGDRIAKPLAAGAGYQYVNMLSADVTAALLHRWQPQLIFSGDDHDDCTYRHPSGAVEVRAHKVPSQPAQTCMQSRSMRYHAAHRPIPIPTQHTVRTFSWMQGNRRPGFGMLSVSPAGMGGTVDAAYASCILPDQLGIFLAYAGLLPVSVVAFFLLRWIARSREAASAARSSALPATSLPFFSAAVPGAGDAGLEKRGSATRATVAEIRRRSSSADTSPLMSPDLATAAPTSVPDELRRRSPWLADMAAFFRMVAALVVLYVGLHLRDHLDR